MTKASVWARSLLFTLTFYPWTLIVLGCGMPLALGTRAAAYRVPLFWSVTTRWLLRRICGIRIRIEGMENLPKENGYIFASKHQSALETTLFHSLIPNVFYVLKRELLWIPFTAVYFYKTGCIPINRSAGTTAMRKMLDGVQANLKKGLNFGIFPEGTRTPPGQKKPYAPGVAFVYDKCRVPVVPIALNSGYCWPKNSLIKYPGTISVRIMKPIPAGLDKRVFLDTLYDTIETAQDALPNPFGKQA